LDFIERGAVFGGGLRAGDDGGKELTKTTRENTVDFIDDESKARGECCVEMKTVREDEVRAKKRRRKNPDAVALGVKI
jgi:hypothetical protein